MPALAQTLLTEDDYARAESMLSSSTMSKVYHRSIIPNWMENDRFWYRTRMREGTRFMFVDPEAGVHRPLFDHDLLANTLSTVLDMDVRAEALPLSGLKVDGDNLSFRHGDQTLMCDIVLYTCAAVVKPDKSTSSAPLLSVRSPDGKLAAFRRDNNLWIHELATGRETQLTFDGEEDFGYATNNAGWVKNDRSVVLWSPDSKKIATFQHDGRNVGEMYMVTTGIGRSELEAWKYPPPPGQCHFHDPPCSCALRRSAHSSVEHGA